MEMKSMLNMQNVANDNNVDTSDMFTDRLDMCKYMASPHNRISDDITSDFVMAKLSDKDKTFTIEMTVNAYTLKYFMLSTISHIKVNDDLYDQKIKKIHFLANSIFDDIINRVYLLTILNRNVADNFLMKLMLKDDEQKQDIVIPTDEVSFLDKLKGSIMGKKKIA